MATGIFFEIFPSKSLKSFRLVPEINFLIISMFSLHDAHSAAKTTQTLNPNTAGMPWKVEGKVITNPDDTTYTL
jgi:hypothetical protein